jgi:hypothetical protein
MNFPQAIIDRFANPERRMTLFGMDIHSLNREELIAAVYLVGEELELARSMHQSTLDMFKFIRKI